MNLAGGALLLLNSSGNCPAPHTLSDCLPFD
jgi:hypothetical protein